MSSHLDKDGGKSRAEYGKQLLVTLAKDLTLLNGKGFNRTNLTYMRKLYLAFLKWRKVIVMHLMWDTVRPLYQ